MSVTRWITVVRDHIPLEQGLRPTEDFLADNAIVVRDHIPLEQGLRLDFKHRNFFLTTSETIFH